ncbi:MAG: hypothetical protein LBL39_06775 [Planctomycetaceae bacterium]|nr:hypothetical protein [Planctomycetaceae bacterium]
MERLFMGEAYRLTGYGITIIFLLVAVFTQAAETVVELKNSAGVHF